MVEIVKVTASKCGGCQYAQKFDAQNMADCFGVPPTVLMIGAGRDVLNRPGIQLEAFVPRVNRERPACSLFRPKVDFSTQGTS